MLMLLTTLLLLANCSNLNLSPKSKMNGIEAKPLNADQEWARKMREERLERERVERYNEKREMQKWIKKIKEHNSQQAKEEDQK